MAFSDFIPDLYYLLKPVLFQMDPERAHALTLRLMRRGLVPSTLNNLYPSLATKVAGLDFPNPIGIAAGFDKQAEVIDETLELGFGFAEIGGVAPLPQVGNPKPRIFRLREIDAIINYMNFPSDGFDAVERRVAAWFDSSGHAFFDAKDKPKRGIVGINITKGDHADNPIESYVKGLVVFAPYLDFVTVNVSCPNTKDPRGLEGREKLAALLQAVMNAHKPLKRKPLVFVKISPDQTDKQMEDIAEVALTSGIHGMIVGNTTMTRPEGMPRCYATIQGGLSGKPLFALSTQVLATMYRLTKGKLPLIGCGGVSSGEDAYAKIRNGASLVQLYTSLVYKGPFLMRHIQRDLAKLLERDGFKSVSEAVGVSVD